MPTSILASVSSLTQVLTGLGLVGALFKPIGPLVDTLSSTVTPALGPTVNPALAPLGLSLLATPNTNGTTDQATNNAPNTTQATNTAQDPQCVVEAYEVPPPSQFTFPPYNKDDATLYRYRQQQSVNLGGWFALESWMTPSLFTCAAGNKTAELDFAMGWGTPELARMMIERHWDTFMTEADFAYLASIGINTVRIPIGYWSLGPAFLQGTPFEAYASVYTNAWARVVRAVNAAGKYKMGVDLHGAPGSQNGLPSSGISSGVEDLFLDPTNVQKTLAVLSFLTQQLAPVSNVVGMQILNEPYPDKNLEQFYNMTIATLRSLTPEALSLPYYIHDSFDLARFSKFVSTRPDFVVMDHHSYFIFSPSDAAEAASNHTSEVQTDIATALYDASQTARRNMIIGEFSCALSDQSLAKESDPDAARRNFCTTQMEVYANISSGWSFWSYNEENCQDDPAWCFRNVIGNSLPSSFSSYPNAPSKNVSRSSAKPSDSLPAMSTSLLSTINALAPPPIDKALGSAMNGTISDVDGAEDLPVTPGSASNAGTQAVSSNAGALGLVKRFGTWARHRSDYAPAARRQSQSSLAAHPRNFKVGRDRQKRAPSSSEQAISLGYSEGFDAGRTFAANNLSKVGFIFQLIEDKLADHVANKDIDESKGDYYRSWFAKGVADAEALVAQAITAESASSDGDAAPAPAADNSGSPSTSSSSDSS